MASRQLLGPKASQHRSPRETTTSKARLNQKRFERLLRLDWSKRREEIEAKSGQYDSERNGAQTTQQKNERKMKLVKKKRKKQFITEKDLVIEGGDLLPRQRKIIRQELAKTMSEPSYRDEIKKRLAQFWAENGILGYQRRIADTVVERPDGWKRALKCGPDVWHKKGVGFRLTKDLPPLPPTNQ